MGASHPAVDGGMRGAAVGSYSCAVLVCHIGSVSGPAGAAFTFLGIS